MTISAWIKSTAWPRGDAAIVSSYNGLGFQLDTTTDEGLRTIGFKLGSSCGTLMARYGATPLALNTWVHVAGVYNAKRKTIDIYLNGELDNGALAGPVTGTQSSARANVYVGRRSDHWRSGFLGEIGDVRIYSRPLTKEEVVADMSGFVDGSRSKNTEVGDLGQKQSSSGNVKDICFGTPEGEDTRLPCAAAMLGVLVAIALAGLWTSSGTFLYLVASIAAGLSIVPMAGSGLVGWMLLLLSLAGSASVACTMRHPYDALGKK